MNLKDVMAKATPGPFKVEGGTAIMAPTGWKADRDRWVLGASENVHIASTDQNHRSFAEQKANAAMLAHSYNMLPKLVEWMKEALAEDSSLNDMPWVFSEGEKLLKEAEEVKI